MSSLPHQQNIADMLKTYVLKLRGKAQRASLEVVQRFESAPWYPEMFEEALAEYPEMVFEGHWVHFEGEPDAAPHVAIRLMNRYCDLVEERTGQVVSSPMADLMTTAEVEVYVSEAVTAGGKSLARRGVRKYIRNPEFDLMRGTMKGRTLLITRAEADEFVDWYLKTDVKPGVKPGAKWSEKRQTAERRIRVDER